MKIDGKTRLVGILGDPVAHSLSPGMQNAALASLGLNICYVPLPVEPEQLPEAVAGLRAMQFRGANVTIPHKIAVANLLDSLDVSAVRTGAVNTIVNNDGTLTGHNTDGIGFIRALAEVAEVDFSEAPALILGAGGAARAVAVALAENGCPRITIINRTPDRANQLKTLLVSEFPAAEVTVRAWEDDLGEPLAQNRLVVNATSLGMKSNLKQAWAGVDKLTASHVVCDLVYSTKQTSLLTAAKEKGATLMGGTGMLLHQGAASFKLWTAREAPLDVMRKALEP